MNILILSCGTRNKLVEFFKESSEFDNVIVTDCSQQAPALYVADKYYIVPRMTEDDYFSTILDICVKLNALSPIEVTLLGICTLVKLRQ